MTGRTAVFAALLTAGSVPAQFPHQPGGRPLVASQTLPGEPRRLSQPSQGPSPSLPQTPADPGGPAEGPSAGARPDPSVVLPRQEHLVPLDPGTLTVRRLPDSWQLWAGPVLLRDFGTSGQVAQDAVAAFDALKPTAWGSIGTPRAVVEYGLSTDRPAEWLNGRPPPNRLPVDLKTVRAEPVRGAWVVRDDANILLNFGPHRGDAEQAAAVARRYGFNRLGRIGFPAPAMSFFYADPAAASAPARNDRDDQSAALAKAAQEASLTRTAVDVPGIGLVGERVALEPRLLDARRDQGEWVLANGPDVLARFGYSELAARDALRVVKDAHLTEFCRVGTGLTFFLSHGLPPTRVSFAAQGTRFDPSRLAARETAPGLWGVCEGNGRVMFPAASREEADLMIRVVRAYKFDQMCQVGSSPKTSLRFLAKVGR